ncbi:kinase-like domain-containing protein [Schizophyllum amplum]|uniref:Kinase-like domain-containing protein n=1 Tax=Schizophyllum amplum TaxID=97359 RepID=A0A550CW70_9AGAR|nr:kinase-like domain-containing protein [Auriculariopsis ampla]
MSTDEVSVALSSPRPMPDYAPPQDVIDELVRFANSDERPWNLGYHALVIPLDDKRVLKTSSTVTLKEAKAMEYVRQSTTIPVPRVHMAFEHGDDGYIVMDRVEGKPLEALTMLRMTAAEMVNIVKQLKSILTQLSQLHPLSPDEAYHGWPDDPFPVHAFGHEHPTHRLNSLEEFFNYWAMGKHEVLPFGPEHRGSVLAHGDFKGGNIMVLGDQVTGVIDWETFGYYPPFWDRMTIYNWLCVFDHSKDAADEVVGEPDDVVMDFFSIMQASYPI